MEISGSGWPQRGCALTVDGHSADISQRDCSPAHPQIYCPACTVQCPVQGVKRHVNVQSKPAISERRVVAWIGKAVRVEGKVISEEDLTIDGDVEGSIELGGHSLTIGQAARHSGRSARQDRDDQRQGERQRSGGRESRPRATASVDRQHHGPALHDGRRRHRDRQESQAGLGGRQADDKRRAFSFAGTYGGDAPPVHLGEMAHDGQAQTEAAVCAR